MAFVAILLWRAGGLSAASEDPCAGRDWARAGTPSLSLIWNDAYRLGPADLSEVQQELARIFGALDLDVRLTRPRDRRGWSPREVYVVMMPVDSETWGAGSNVLGATVGNPGEKKTVFIFAPNVQHMLGHRRGRGLREKHELARALGRIVAHEAVHVLLPHHPHAARGVMNARWNRSFLVRDELRFDPLIAEALRVKLLWG